MDQFFGEPDYAAAKQEMRRTCYGDLYTFLGNRYFGLGMRQDAATLLREGGALPSRIDDASHALAEMGSDLAGTEILQTAEAVVHGAGT